MELHSQVFLLLSSHGMRVKGLSTRKSCQGLSQRPHRAPGAWAPLAFKRMNLLGERLSGLPGPREWALKSHPAKVVHQFSLWVRECMDLCLLGSRKYCRVALKGQRAKDGSGGPVRAAGQGQGQASASRESLILLQALVREVFCFVPWSPKGGHATEPHVRSFAQGISLPPMSPGGVIIAN